MDDIRNTSALFVGGQDTAPHIERTARELWQLLFQKTENEMAGYMNRLNGIPFVPQKLRNFPAILEHRKIQTNPL